MTDSDERPIRSGARQGLLTGLWIAAAVFAFGAALIAFDLLTADRLHTGLSLGVAFFLFPALYFLGSPWSELLLPSNDSHPIILLLTFWPGFVINCTLIGALFGCFGQIAKWRRKGREN